MIEYNSSGYIIGDMLLQYNKQGFLKPCIYFLKKNSLVKCNYKIYDKKLLMIIYYFKNWDTELRLVKKFVVITDHKNLEYFINLRKLNKKQMRWSIFMSQYNMELIYQSGKKNQKADILSRRKQDALSGNDIRILGRKLQLLKSSYPEIEGKEEKEEELKWIMTIKP